NATVTYGGDDLVESLIQYPGTAPPGKIGNSVVFGHSVLPQFFNADDYLTIFSTLPEMEIGKFIFVEHQGVSYKYKVEDMFEVRPTDVHILTQDDSGSFLSLVTCTPPGDPFKPKRLVVRARLMPNLTADADTSD
ncbi:sortase, partial [Patescibacteria group bacterium]